MNDYSKTPIIELAALVASHLQNNGINVVLVGGLAVEIYTENLYLTKDIDMVDIGYNRPAVLQSAMAEIGFIKKGRVYVNSSTEICVEFPTAPLTVGDTLVQKTSVVAHSCGDIPILLAIDVVKDRLAAYFHWQDKPSLVQALAIMSNHSIDSCDIKKFCTQEGAVKEYALISKLYSRVIARSFDSMNDIEHLVIEETLSNL